MIARRKTGSLTSGLLGRKLLNFSPAPRPGNAMVARLLIAVLVLSLIPVAYADEAPLVIPTTPAATQAASKDLAVLIGEAIKLLDANKNREAIELLMQPSVMANEKAAGNFDAIVNGFVGARAQAVLQVLKSIHDQAPKFNDDQTKATFTPAQNIPDAPSGTITFIKENGSWHIQGD